jgi:hypothetical protein
MGVIRKISVGPDYKSGAMHYIAGQSILNGTHTIHLIKLNKEKKSIEIWIQSGEEILVWKEFSETVPISIEYNINF